MSHLDIKIPHTLSRDEVISRIKKLFSELQIQHKDKIKNVAEEWTQEEGKIAFSASGFSVSANVNVSPHTITITGKLPFLLSLSKGKISDMIKEKASALLK